MGTYDTWDAALVALTSALGETALSEDQRQAVEAVVDALEERGKGTHRQGIILRSWVVRSDDVDLVGQLVDGVSAAAGSTFFTDGAVVPSLTGASVAIFRALRAIYGKGVRLPSDDLRLLIHLKRFGPLTAAQLHGDICVSSSLIDDSLRRLSSVAVNDGSIVALVEMDSSDRWTTAC